MQAPRRRKKKPSYRGLENKDPPPTHPRGDSKEPRRRLPRNGSPQGTPDMAICVGEPRGRRASPCETVINREKDRNLLKKKFLIKHMSGFGNAPPRASPPLVELALLLDAFQRTSADRDSLPSPPQICRRRSRRMPFPRHPLQIRSVHGVTRRASPTFFALPQRMTWMEAQ